MRNNTENRSDRLDSLVYEYVGPSLNQLSPGIPSAYTFGIRRPKTTAKELRLTPSKKYIQNQPVLPKWASALHPPPKGRGFTARRDKNGPYIGEGEPYELEDWEEPTDATPTYLSFHFNVLGSAPWKEKVRAVERLMKEGISPDIDVEEIEYASFAPWRQQLRRRFEAHWGEERDFEAEEERIRNILK